MPLPHILPVLPCRWAEVWPDLAPSLEVKPGADEYNSEVEDYVYPYRNLSIIYLSQSNTILLTEYPKVSPYIFWMHVEARRKLSTVRILTKSTTAVRLCLHIPAYSLSIWPGIRLAALSWRWVKYRKLRSVTLDGNSISDQAKHALEEIFEWRDPIHPTPPEIRQSRVRDNYTAETDNCRSQ